MKQTLLDQKALQTKVTGDQVTAKEKWLDKIAALPDSGEMAVRDAASLCHTGIQLKENI